MLTVMFYLSARHRARGKTMQISTRISADGERTFYYNGGSEVVAIVRRKPGTQFWLADTYAAVGSEAGSSEHATRTAAEETIALRFAN